MYLAHYRLKEKPFSISPDPKFLWLGETHREALATLRYGIQENRGFLLLVGDVGTGKTTLINRLVNSLSENILLATVSDPGLTQLEFYNYLSTVFKMGKKYESKGDFLVHFVHFLHKANATGRQVLLIIDEAQRLSDEMLEEIRLLSNFERQDEKLINIFLVGQNELHDKLLKNQNRALRQRITMHYNINPLKKKDVPDYIRFRLNVAGANRKIFANAAIREVVRFSKGYPRLINIICDHALLTGFTKEQSIVTASTVKECAKELRFAGESTRKPQIAKENLAHTAAPKRRLGWIVAIIVVLVIIGAALFVYWKAGLPMMGVNQKPASMENPSDQSASPPIPIAPPETPPPAASQAPEPEPEPEQAAVTSPPQPEAPEPVAPLGPPPTGILVTIEFRPDSNEFAEGGISALNQFAVLAHQYPDTQVRVIGYTDATGNEQYNQRLSAFRAEVVKSYLLGQGVESKRIAVIGMGSASPVATNTTVEGRQANRRVEIELTATN